MKITNNFGLPEAFMNFVRDDKYSKGDADISVTTLIDAPRVRLLKEAHADDIETDVVDRVWSLFGTAVHHVLESADDGDRFEKEERVYAEEMGWRISGAMDHQELLPNGTIQITDYKVTSAWSVILGKEAWDNQLNLYAELVERDPNNRFKGRVVSSIRVCAILRDWMKKKAQFDPSYPQSPVVMIDLPLWDREDREAYLLQRIAVHQDAEFLYRTDGTLPECKADEMWEKPTVYAVKKVGGKRALKLFDTQKEAEDHQLEVTDKTEIEVRPGERTRCEGYCDVAEFCTQFQEYRSRDKA